MAKPGRKRKNNVSLEGGDKPRAPGIMENMRPVLERRCKTMGWRPTPENLQRARDNRLGTLPGRLHVAGLLSARAYDGIMEYAVARVNWLRAIDAPQEWPKSAAIGDMPARGSIVSLFDEEGHQNTVRRFSERYMDAEGALIESRGKDWVLWSLRQEDDKAPLDVQSGIVDALEKAGCFVARKVL